MPYSIRQCYLPPGRCDIPTFTGYPNQILLVLDLAGEMQAELVGCIQRYTVVYPPKEGSPVVRKNRCWSPVSKQSARDPSLH